MHCLHHVSESLKFLKVQYLPPNRCKPASAPLWRPRPYSSGLGRHSCQEKQRKLPILWARHPDSIWCIAYLRKGRAKQSWSWAFLEMVQWKHSHVEKGEVFLRSVPWPRCWKEHCAQWSRVFHDVSSLPQAESGAQSGFRGKNWGPDPREKQLY